MCTALGTTTVGKLKHSAHDARLEGEIQEMLKPRGVIDNRNLFGVKQESRAVEVTNNFLLTALRSFRHMLGIGNGVSIWGFVFTRIRFAVFPFIDLREFVAVTEIESCFIKNLFLLISVDSFCRLSIPTDCFSKLFHRRVIVLMCSAATI